MGVLLAMIALGAFFCGCLVNILSAGRDVNRSQSLYGAIVDIETEGGRQKIDFGQEVDGFS